MIEGRPPRRRVVGSRSQRKTWGERERLESTTVVHVATESDAIDLFGFGFGMTIHLGMDT
jgi:hypothetical protein